MIDENSILFDLSKDEIDSLMRIKKNAESSNKILKRIYIKALDDIKEDYSNIIEVEEDAKEIWEDISGKQSTTFIRGNFK